MNKLSLFALLLMSITFSFCQQEVEPAQVIKKVAEPEIIKGITLDKKDYTIHINIEKVNEEQHNIVVFLELHNDSYIISPTEEKDFGGKLAFDFGSTENIDISGSISESPISYIEEGKHPYLADSTKTISVNTTFKQPIIFKTHEDFEVFGRVLFVIEPACTMEKITYAIKIENGKIKLFYPKC